MIQHNTFGFIHRNGIALRIADIAQTDTNKPHYHVGSIDHQRIVGNTYTVARGRLTVDSKTSRFDTQFAIEMYRAGSSEQNTSGTGLGDGIAECTRHRASRIGIQGIIHPADTIDSTSVTACDCSTAALNQPACCYQLRIRIYRPFLRGIRCVTCRHEP